MILGRLWPFWLLQPDFYSSMTTIRKLLNHVSIAAVLTSIAAYAAENFTPFATVEATYTDSGNKFKGSPIRAPDGYELGVGLTAGVRLNLRHEFSFSTGYTKFEGAHNVIPGFFDGQAKAEQIPLLLNYRYRLPIDSKGRFTVFAGPTLGFIHEKHIQHNVNLGALPANVTGTSTDSDFRFSYGGTLGFDAKLTDHWTAGLSAQLLRVDSASYSEYSGAATTHYATVTRPSFALTIGYGW